MPQRNNNPEPPVMTGSKRLAIVAVAFIFDAARFFFTLFWFWGPAIAGLYCTLKVNGILTTYSLGLLSTKTAAALCAGAAIVGGTAVSAFTTPFGVVMADAVGLAGFLVLGLWILMTNARIFKTIATGSLWFVGAFLIGEIPFIGGLPVFSVALWRIYGAQIKAETAKHAKWEKENAKAALLERNRQAMQLMQIRTLQQAQAERQEAANEERFYSAEAANDAQYEIPEEVRKAA